MTSASSLFSSLAMCQDLSSPPGRRRVSRRSSSGSERHAAHAFDALVETGEHLARAAFDDLRGAGRQR